MPWCPNCKKEYQKGITCADCNTTLVESLENQPFDLMELADLEEEDASKRLVNFLEFSGIQDVTSEFFPETSTWKISVNGNDSKEAKKLYKAFLTAETSEEEKLEHSKKEKEENKDNTYVKKEDKYNDYKSSAYLFLPFGILGLVFIILNITETLNFIGNTFQMIVLTLCFIGFIYVGITSMLRLNSLKEEVREEQDNTSSIIQWMKANITKEVLSNVTDKNVSDEVNYIHQTDKIKEMILEEYKNLDENFIDQLIEDYYNKYID